MSDDMLDAAGANEEDILLTPRRCGEDDAREQAHGEHLALPGQRAAVRACDAQLRALPDVRGTKVAQ